MHILISRQRDEADDGFWMDVSAIIEQETDLIQMRVWSAASQWWTCQMLRLSATTQAIISQQESTCFFCFGAWCWFSLWLNVTKWRENCQLDSRRITRRVDAMLSNILGSLDEIWSLQIWWSFEWKRWAFYLWTSSFLCIWSENISSQNTPHFIVLDVIWWYKWSA